VLSSEAALFRVRLGSESLRESRMRNVAKSKMWPSRFKLLSGKRFRLNFTT